MDAIVPVPDAGPGHWLTGHTAQQGWPRPGKQGNAGIPRPVSARKASSGYRRLCRQCPGCQDSAARPGPLPRHNCHILCTGSEKGAEIRVIVWPVPAETCPPFAVKASDRLLGLVGENRSKGIRSSLSHPNGSESRLRSLQGQRFPGRTTGRRFAGRPDGLCRSSLHGDSVMSDARHAPGLPGCIARFRRHSCERPVRSAGSACTALLAPTRRSPEPGSGVFQLHNKETT